jgi:hypothetical protein
MSVEQIIKEAMDRNPIGLKESLQEELRSRIALALEAKMKEANCDDEDAYVEKLKQKESLDLDEAVKSKNMIHIGHPDDYTDDPWKHEVYINGKKVLTGGYGPFKIDNKTVSSVDAFIRLLAKKYNVPENSFDLYSLDGDAESPQKAKPPKLTTSGFKPRANIRESEDLDEAKGSKAYFGTNDGKSYAVNLSGAKGGNEPRNMGWAMDNTKMLKDFMKDAKTHYAGAKGKATLPAVKSAIKMLGATEFYATWKADSANYKDDSVKIYYK